MDIAIERVTDVAGRWADIEPLLRALHEYHLPLTGVPLLADWPRMQRDHLASLSDEIVLLAYHEGRMVGFVNGSIAHTPTIFEEHYARLANAYVVPEVRGSSIGQQLLAAFEQWAREQGVSEVRLGVVTGNVLGERFWHSAGFTPASTAMKKQL